jgi:tRNA pseudouridine55 synthase
VPGGTLGGVVLADKPAGLSSHDLVNRARRALGTRRVGHAGTLDPFATGLLILLVGRATRTQRFFTALPKTYEVVVRLGARSTTGDPEGQIVETGRVPPDPLILPVGEIRQRPPAFSAVKLDGVRAYERARRGEHVEMPERTVRIHEFTALWRSDDRAALRVVCSAGTYVRSLVAALGDAYCLELRRVAIGPFMLDGAWSGEGPATLTGLTDALAEVMPVRLLDPQAARAVAHGRPVAGGPANGPVLLLDEDGPVAIAEPRPAADPTELRPVIGFRGE